LTNRIQFAKRLRKAPGNSFVDNAFFAGQIFA
jgi:hypothetical protein